MTRDDGAARYNASAEEYMAGIARALDEAELAALHETGSERAMKITLARLIPGIAFRELWPYDNGDWSPLQPYQPPTTSNARIPRKGDPATAQWLLGSMLTAVPERTHTDRRIGIRILCIGDGEGDVRLAELLNGASTQTMAPDVKAFIYDRDGQIARQSRDFVSYFRSWPELACACIDDMKRSWGHYQFLLIDVDRTLLLPRGLCDTDYDTIGERAFLAYSLQFRKNYEQPTAYEIGKHYKMAKSFRLYCTPGIRHYKDEDIRVFAALALATGLFLEDDLDRGMDQLIDWVQLAHSRCVAGEWNPQEVEEGRLSLPGKDWDQAALKRKLESMLILTYRDGCSIAPGYRAEEERVLLDLAEKGRCFLNGHVVDIIREAVMTKTAIPLAYSDRPSASVGLQLMSYYRSRPVTVRQALVEHSLPCFWAQ